PPTQPGYGPNTRTVMQIQVRNITPAAPYNLATLNTVFAKTATKRGVFEASQDEIIVPNDNYNSAYNQAFPADTYVRIYQNAHTFQTVPGPTVTLPLEPKAIQDEMGEAYDKDYGRMSAMLGLELPGTVAGAQTFVLYPFASPPVEILKGTVYGTPIGAMDDGTQLWKITHNGVDTHTIHTHLYNAQIINRVAWDNALRLPDLNELGWKETFRINPLQDTIIALRPILPTQPFKVGNSIRLIDPTMPENAVLPGGPLGFMDPNGNPVTVLNQFVNYGWEYVYHCHLLAHEEMDMMHSVAVAVPPEAPSTLTATSNAGAVDLAWMDNSLDETDWIIQTAAADIGPWTDLVTVPSTTGPTTGPVTYPGATAASWYRIVASNTVGSMIAGFPTMTAVSAPSNAASPTAATYSISGTVTATGGAPVAGVTMSLTGDATASTTTAADGTYSFTGLANGSYTVTPSLGANTFAPASSPATITNASVTGVNFTMNAYSISGTVTATGGAPVAGVTMFLTGAAIKTTTTAADGTYSFAGLGTGSYTVTPNLGTNTFTPASSPVAIINASVTGVNFTMIVTTYSISGTVTTTGGSPIGGVTISLTGTSAATTATDASGNYTFTGLSNGSYIVTPSMAGYTFNPLSRNVTINFGNVTGQDFTGTTATRISSISGTVTTSGGSPIAGVTITLTGAASGTTTTNGAGQYSLGGVANGSYIITPSMGGYTFTPLQRSVLVKGKNITGQNFTGTPAAGIYSISGTVSTSGAVPIAGVTMSLTGTATATTTTDVNGSYTFTGLSNGNYIVTPSMGGYTFTPLNRSVPINGANVTGQDFTGTPVAGTYSISGTVSTSVGTPIANVTMTLSGGASGTTTTNGAGQYSFTNLTNGSYVVTPSRALCSFIPSSRSVTISGGDVAGQNFVGKCK
ncbi:MAG: carboxypeptidase regulatory-like domain-containing protein, partial [Nitrospirota bacterium]|nr:carboxypeptidase regulatory-like domain-containing protein [Nitrospirota bacterium]